MEQVKITVPEKIVAFSNGLVQWAKAFIIDSDEKNVEVVDKLKLVKNAIKDIKKEEDEHTKPPYAIYKKWKKKYEPVYVPFTEAKDILEKKVLDRYHKKQDDAAKEQARLRREETLQLKKLEEEKAALEAKGIKLNIPEQEAPIPPVVAAPSKKVSGVYSKMTIPTKPAFRLVDISQVPVKYLLLNEVAVNQAAKAGIKNISGLEWYEKESVMNR